MGLALGLLLAAGAVALWLDHRRAPDGSPGGACYEDFSCRPPGRCFFSVCWSPDDLPKDSYIYTDEYWADAERIRHILFDHLALAPGMRVADVGAGAGELTFPVARAVGTKGRVFATDINPHAVQRLAAQVAASALSQIEPRLVRAERDTGLQDLPPASLDRILLINSVSFRDGKGGDADLHYLSSLRARLAPDGCLVLHTDWLEPDHLDRAAVERLFQRAGFAVPAREIAQPAHIPATAIRYHRGVFGIHGDPLRRGFLLVFGAGPAAACGQP